MLHIPGLYIQDTEDKQRAVYTAHEVNPGDVIEICHVIMIPKGDVETVHSTILHDYYFVWPDDSGRLALALGYGSIYNHSATPNAEIVFDLDAHTIIFQCIQTIAAGDEICIDYQGGVKNAPSLWFDPV